MHTVFGGSPMQELTRRQEEILNLIKEWDINIHVKGTVFYRNGSYLFFSKKTDNFISIGGLDLSFNLFARCGNPDIGKTGHYDLPAVLCGYWSIAGTHIKKLKTIPWKKNVFGRNAVIYPASIILVICSGSGLLVNASFFDISLFL